MKVLFLVPYPLHQAPSQRFRFEQYFLSFQDHHIQYRVQSFLDEYGWKVWYGKGKVGLKFILLFLGFFKRVMVLFQIRQFEYIFIHREVAPMGPPVFEWIIYKIFKKKILYDFDDAIWMTDRVGESLLLKMMRNRNKVRRICTWSNKISVGNQFLRAFALQFNSTVIYNPTTIDTDWHRPPKMNLRESEEVIIGWTGSHSTLKYIKEVEQVLLEIGREFPNVKMVIIADQRPQLLFPFIFIPWNIQTEVKDLMQLDVGIMPLPDDEWSKGKCGFKILQYMALSIPAVASAVGSNKEIIEHGKNGFLVSNDDEWKSALVSLIQDSALRRKMGEEGRKKVMEQYSVNSNMKNFYSLFREI